MAISNESLASAFRLSVIAKRMRTCPQFFHSNLGYPFPQGLPCPFASFFGGLKRRLKNFIFLLHKQNKICLKFAQKDR